MEERAADINAIKDVIARQFASMSWSAPEGPDTPMFKSDFLPSAPLYPSARPVLAMSLEKITPHAIVPALVTLPQAFVAGRWAESERQQVQVRIVVHGLREPSTRRLSEGA